jgi:lipopolysaccharide/colanic/teichoic acid biosynthesis glycosyltransferase
MKVLTYKQDETGGSGALLRFIFDAFEAGDSVAVQASHAAVLGHTDLCTPLASGELAGCFLFEGVSERSRLCSVSERLLAMVLVVLLFPLYVFLYLAVLIVDRPPVVFRQKRFGLDNRVFNIYKFRTMVPKGEKLHSKMQQRWGKEGRLFKMDNDPRVTRLGTMLRSAYLDELPQLFNVIKGDMRLFGPRPLPASDEHHYLGGYHRMRLRGMPGVTGLWQVSGRNKLTFDEMALLDLYYICNGSFRMDVLILLKTLKMLLARKA